MAQFIAALVSKAANREIEQACALTNNATETRWAQNAMLACAAVCFLSGRVRFLDINGVANGAPLQGQAIMYFGRNRRPFAKSFEKFGCVFFNRGVS
jgi:hypothetical protein